MPMSREAKTAWQRKRRHEEAKAAGRKPGVVGRPKKVPEDSTDSKSTSNGVLDATTD